MPSTTKNARGDRRGGPLTAVGIHAKTRHPASGRCRTRLLSSLGPSAPDPMGLPGPLVCRTEDLLSHSSYLFTSESVSEGHPDKVCDRISDTIVDLFLAADPASRVRSEEHTSELQSLMRISYAVFCLKKKNTHKP